jgi:hypothetical protein
MNDDFKLWEEHVMRQLGLCDRDDIRSMREELLVEGQDWAKVGQRIMLSSTAAEKLAAHLNGFPAQLAGIRRVQVLSGGLDQSAAEKRALPLLPQEPHAVKTSFTCFDGPTELVRMVLLPQRVLNPRIIIARPASADPNDRSAWVNVRVKTAVNFRPPPAETGEILARHIEGKLWEFAGNPKSTKNDVPRCPRWPGKW